MTDEEKELIRKEKAKQYYKKHKERIKAKSSNFYYNKKHNKDLNEPYGIITIVYDDVIVYI